MSAANEAHQGSGNARLTSYLSPELLAERIQQVLLSTQGPDACRCGCSEFRRGSLSAPRRAWRRFEAT